MKKLLLILLLTTCLFSKTYFNDKNYLEKGTYRNGTSVFMVVGEDMSDITIDGKNLIEYSKKKEYHSVYYLSQEEVTIFSLITVPKKVYYNVTIEKKLPNVYYIIKEIKDKNGNKTSEKFTVTRTMF